MSSKTPAKSASDRDARLKAALKANMARRKAQARARTTSDDDTGNSGQTRKER